MAGKSLFLDTTGITRILNPCVLCNWKLLTEITHHSGVFCPLWASDLSREDGRWLPNSRKAACESQLREPGFGKISLPSKQGPKAAHALGHFHGLFAKGDCNLLAKLEVPCGHPLGAVGFC